MTEAKEPRQSVTTNKPSNCGIWAFCKWIFQRGFCSCGKKKNVRIRPGREGSAYELESVRIDRTTDNKTSERKYSKHKRKTRISRKTVIGEEDIEQENRDKLREIYSERLKKAKYYYSISNILGNVCSIFILKDVLNDDEQPVTIRMLLVSGYMIALFFHSAGRVYSEPIKYKPYRDYGEINEQKDIKDETDTIDKPCSWSSLISNPYKFILDLMPTTLLLGTSYYLAKTIQEDVDLDDIQPVILLGFITGNLLQLTISPWKLLGLRDYIRNNRNRFIILEYGCNAELILFLSRNACCLIMSAWYSILMGYNNQDFFCQAPIFTPDFE